MRERGEERGGRGGEGSEEGGERKVEDVDRGWRTWDITGRRERRAKGGRERWADKVALGMWLSLRGALHLRG